MVLFPRLFSRSSAAVPNKSDVPSVLRVDSVPLRNLKALGGIFKPGITKAGRLSLMGTTSDNQTVKIYGAFSLAQVALRVGIENMQPSRDIFFPKLLLHDRSLLVEKWVHGTPLNMLTRSKAYEYSDRVEAYLHTLQNDRLMVGLAEMHADAFCYLSNYLIPRLEPWAHWEPVQVLVSEWQHARETVIDTLPKRLTHPDLSLSNLIVERHTDKLYVIDNELFGVGQGWVIDGKNSFCKERFNWDCLEPPEQRFASLSWKLRLVGSALDSGDFPRAKRLADIH